MEAENFQKQLINIILVFIFKIVLSQQDQTVQSIVREVFGKFNSNGEPRLLQFWACSTPSNSNSNSNSEHAIGCNLLLTAQPFELTPDNEGLLQDYRSICLDQNRHPFVGLRANVGNWSAARAVQTEIADHWTKDHVTIQEDQHSDYLGGMGQLVLPVFDHQGILVGIIELVMPVPKESYAEDFEELQNLLEDRGLKSTYMGKMIKVEYKGDLVKFKLRLSATLKDLHRELECRFPKLELKKLRVKIEDNKGNRLPISSDKELQDHMKDSSSKGVKFIKMFI